MFEKRMDRVLKMGNAFGFGWYFSKPKVNDQFDLQPFLMRRLPIFWIMGPTGCDKSTLAEMLEKANKYHLVVVSNLILEEIAKATFRAKVIEDCMKRGKQVPDEIIVTLIKEYIVLNYASAKGFIFSGFPIHLRQAKLFETEICKVNIIIYCTMVLDSVLKSMITKYGEINTEQLRQQFLEKHENCQAVYRYYEQKTLKVMTNFPLQDTLTKLISDLEDYWGYKFEQLNIEK